MLALSFQIDQFCRSEREGSLQISTHMHLGTNNSNGKYIFTKIFMVPKRKKLEKRLKVFVRKKIISRVAYHFIILNKLCFNPSVIRLEEKKDFKNEI